MPTQGLRRNTQTILSFLALFIIAMSPEQESLRIPTRQVLTVA